MDEIRCLLCKKLLRSLAEAREVCPVHYGKPHQIRDHEENRLQVSELSGLDVPSGAGLAASLLEEPPAAEPATTPPPEPEPFESGGGDFGGGGASGDFSGGDAGGGGSSGD